MDAGLILARLVIGPLMAAHGAQKLFGWFGGYGLTGTGGILRKSGVPARPPVRGDSRRPPKLRAACWLRRGSSARLGRRSSYRSWSWPRSASTGRTCSRNRTASKCRCSTPWPRSRSASLAPAPTHSTRRLASHRSGHRHSPGWLWASCWSAGWRIWGCGVPQHRRRRMRNRRSACGGRRSAFGTFAAPEALPHRRSPAELQSAACRTLFHAAVSCR